MENNYIKQKNEKALNKIKKGKWSNLEGKYIKPWKNAINKTKPNRDISKPNRYIPKDVKNSVWNRDQEKCCECGSKEKIEFDHIIPVSKGGSNTERNIQLLCEKCNRQKSANNAITSGKS